MAAISSLGIGSGLDLNGLLDQLESAEREKLTPITQQQQSYQSKISAFGKLESALDKFQQAAAKLNDADAFRSVKSNVSGDVLTAAAGTDAVPGSYEIEVTALAKAHSLASQGVDDKTRALLKEGETSSLTISAGDGDPIKISLTPENSSLEDIRDAINEQGGGVTASIIDDGNADGEDTPYRLVLTSKETGEESKIASIDVSDESGANLKRLFQFNPDVETGENQSEGMVVTVKPQNAALTVNGIAISSQSNRVEEAIQGVTLNLSKTNEGETETLTVSRDNAAISKNVTAFVDAYNSLQSTMDSLTSFDSETGAAGELLGDSTMRSVETRLRSVMSGGVEDGDMRMLSNLGIQLKLDGKLEVDSEKLDELVANDPESLSRFFSGDGEDIEGLSDKLETSLTQMLDEKGLLGNATTGLEDRISSLNDRYERTESSINATIERYRTQFAQMDSLVSQMNSTMSYLTQQFDAMNAQLGQD